MLKLAQEIIDGKRLGRSDDLSFLLKAELGELCSGADMLRRHFCGERADLCSIINGRSGKCPENCKFCAQSAHHCTGIEEYGFLDEKRILEECLYNESKGVHRFSIVTAGRTVSGEDFQKALSAYRLMKKESSMELCASHGLLTQEQFFELKKAGVKRYHANIETSRRNFPNICTTHTFEDKLECIRRAKNAGLEVCSGGIIGMGETWEDRIDMALTLSELDVRSIPINALIPIKGTALENVERISEEDILRTVAIFRYIVPQADIRLAAGRDLMSDCGRRAFLSGANSTITGDMLTTSGNKINDDKAMLDSIGFSLEREEQ
ncbi:MAG: biotin synthase BioB [Ruminococcus sp.]|nr:biotin synthase BioB [Ruminococcus sp.]